MVPDRNSCTEVHGIMKPNFIHKLMFSGVIALATMMMIGSVFAPVSYTWYWSNDVHFGLSSYGTHIGFSNNIHLGSFVFDSGTAIDFSDVYMGDGNVAEISLSSQTTNMTVTTLSDTQLDYTVNGIGTQQINLGDKEPTYVKLDGVTVIEGIGYTYSGGTVTVNNALSSASIKFGATTDTDIYIPASRGSYTTEAWYFRSDTWTVNTELGYKLHTTQSSSTSYVESTSSSLEDFTVGIKVYRVNEAGDVIPITDTVVAEATQSGATAGTMLNTTYTLSGDTQSLTFDDAIQVEVYHQVGAGSQTAKATYITRNLMTNELNTNTWTLYYYVTVTESAGTYYYRFHYGDASTDSKIVNIQYVTLDPWGRSLYYLDQADLFGFIFNPYSYHLGQEIAFGLVAMLIIIPAYNRYRDIRPVLVLCLLFGGIGGFMTVLIPDIALKISFLFLAIGLGIALYKLLR